MLTVKYSKDGKTVSDFEVERYVYKMINQYVRGTCKDTIVHISNELVIETFRALIVEKKIDHKEVQFLFNGKYLTVNEGGLVSEWPIGFCSTSNGMLDRILMWNSKVR